MKIANKKFIDVLKNNNYTYETNQPIEILKEKIEFIINQKELFDFQFNLTGNLNSDNAFNLNRRLGLIVINDGAGGAPVEIRGKLKKKENGQTSIEVQIRLNFTMVFLPIAFGLVGIGTLTYSIIIGNTQNLFGVFCLFFALTSWGILKYTKDYYKSEFESALNLSKNEIIYITKRNESAMLYKHGNLFFSFRNEDLIKCTFLDLGFLFKSLIGQKDKY